jgi:hypothetical protein
LQSSIVKTSTRTIPGSEREEVIGSWRKLRNEELHILDYSPDIRAMKQRMRWEGHVARTVEMKNAYKVLVVKPERKRGFENLGLDGRIKNLNVV